MRRSYDMLKKMGELTDTIKKQDAIIKEQEGTILELKYQPGGITAKEAQKHFEELAGKK